MEIVTSELVGSVEVCVEVSSGQLARDLVVYLQAINGELWHNYAYGEPYTEALIIHMTWSYRVTY
jgi:hypothetical protein